MKLFFRRKHLLASTASRVAIGFAAISSAISARAFQGGMICRIEPGWASRATANIAAQGLSQLAQATLPPADKLSEPVMVDVMFLYTPQTVVGAGDEASIHEKILESVAEANRRFTNSQINVRIDPVFIGRIDYAESGSMETDLARLANGEGSFSRVATLRNNYKADIVGLITEFENQGIGGYAWDIPPLRGNASLSFFAIRRVFIGKGTMVMAHELGHLFGCHHDREHAGDLNAPWLKDRRKYIFGHRLEIEGVTYVDVMSYEPGIYLPYFANPRITLDGARLGVPDSEARPSDPARTINETAPYVARYHTALSRVEFEYPQYEVTEKLGGITLGLMRSGDLNSSTRVAISIGAASAAQAGSDYIRPEIMTVAFAANQSEASFTIPILADDVAEPAEELRLSLTSPLGYHGIGRQGETLILIRDVQPIVQVSQQVFAENSGTIDIQLHPAIPTIAVFNFGEVPAQAYPESIKWRLEPESARPGEDYVDAAGEIAVGRFGWGTTDGIHISLVIRPIGITLMDDNKPEPDKVFRLIAEGATGQQDGEPYVYASVTNIIRIVDDDRLGAVAPMSGAAAAPDGGMNAAVRHDEKLLVWGGFAPGRSLERLSVALLRSDGSLDPNFNPPDFLAGHRKMEGVGSAQIATVEFLPDGKFLVAGQFSRINGQVRSTLARLNADGSLDESFGQGLTFDGSILEVVVQPDGKILVGGSFEKINGERHAFIARLESDGSIDATFQPDGGPSSDWTVHVPAIALQHDGKILIGGVFKKVDGIPALNIARLHPDGRLDTSFKLKEVSGPVNRIAIQTDGRIIIGGLFDTVGGRASRKIVRIRADGSNDPSFRPPQPNDEVREVLSLPDGRLLMSGAFTTVANTMRRFIALLNADGTLNHEFDPGVGPDQHLGPVGSHVSRAMSIHANGSLYIAGEFQQVSGLPAGGIVRLKLGEPGSAITEVRLNDSGEILFSASVFPGGIYPIEATADFVQWAEIDSLRTESYERKAMKRLPRHYTNRFFRLKNGTR